MKRALLHSGGNARGAVAVPVLAELNPHDYDYAVGVSVGAINLPEWSAQHVNRLRQEYESVDGLGYYLQKNWPWNWHKGFTNLNPLRYRMDRFGTKPEDQICPVYFGVYDYQGDIYRTMTSYVRSEWLDMRCASASIPVVMEGKQLASYQNRFHTCFDGGMRHVIPDLPDWMEYDAIDVILCSPLERSNYKDASELNTIWEIASRTIDIWIDTTVVADIARLRMYAKAGKKVRVFAPKWAGPSFDAKNETMLRRLEEGEKMKLMPVVF